MRLIFTKASSKEVTQKVIDASEMLCYPGSRGFYFYCTYLARFTSSAFLEYIYLQATSRPTVLYELFLSADEISLRRVTGCSSVSILCSCLARVNRIQNPGSYLFLFQFIFPQKRMASDAPGQARLEPLSRTSQTQFGLIFLLFVHSPRQHTSPFKEQLA